MKSWPFSKAGKDTLNARQYFNLMSFIINVSISLFALSDHLVEIAEGQRKSSTSQLAVPRADVKEPSPLFKDGYFLQAFEGDFFFFFVSSELCYRCRTAFGTVLVIIMDASIIFVFPPLVDN